MEKAVDGARVLFPPPLIYVAGLALGIAGDRMVHLPRLGLQPTLRDICWGRLCRCGVAGQLCRRGPLQAARDRDHSVQTGDAAGDIGHLPMDPQPDVPGDGADLPGRRHLLQ